MSIKYSFILSLLLIILLLIVSGEYELELAAPEKYEIVLIFSTGMAVYLFLDLRSCTQKRTNLQCVRFERPRNKNAFRINASCWKSKPHLEEPLTVTVRIEENG